MQSQCCELFAAAGLALDQYGKRRVGILRDLTLQARDSGA